MGSLSSLNWLHEHLSKQGCYFVGTLLLHLQISSNGIYLFLKKLKKDIYYLKGLARGTILVIN